MNSSFRIKKSDCMSCNNHVLKTLGELRGVYSADLDRVNGYIVVGHTDEVVRADIQTTLANLGWEVIENEATDNSQTYTPPSEWGCAL